MAESDIHKLISLTFDEDPKVRLDAAAKLSKTDDPAALFALMELSYDKDLEVKNFAQRSLEKKKSEEEEVMSFAEIFSTHPETDTQQPTDATAIDEKKARMLSPITKLFEKKLGKQRADRVRQRMMPAIEKVYMKSTMHHTGEPDPGRKVIQEFLTSYLDAISSIESIASPNGALKTHHPLQDEVLKGEHEMPHSLSDELEEVSRDHNVEGISEEVHQIETREKEEAKEEESFEKLPDTAFKKAYEAMILSSGDERIMKREMKRMQRNLEHDMKLAYHLAKRKFKETNLTHLVKLKDDMRNVTTDILTVKSVEPITYKKGKEMKTANRIVVHDLDENEGIVYLFDNRGMWLQKGMHIKVVKGQVKTFAFSGETALSIGNKGNVYVVL